MLVNAGGREQVVIVGAQQIVGIDTENGERCPHTGGNNSVSPRSQGHNGAEPWRESLLVAQRGKRSLGRVHRTGRSPFDSANLLGDAAADLTAGTLECLRRKRPLDVLEQLVLLTPDMLRQQCAELLEQSN